MQVQTPVSHQANREALLKSWIENICSKSGSLIASSLTDAKSASGVDDLLFGEGSKVKSAVMSLVQSNIPSMMEMFADPSKKQADIVQEISEKILGSVEKAYQARAEDLVSFFNHQEAKLRSPAFGKSQPVQQEMGAGKRSIFSSASKADKASAEKALIQSAISNKMEILYPNQLSLHRDILAGALGANGSLVAEIGHCVCSRVPSHHGRRGGARRRLRDGEHHGAAGHAHRDHGHHTESHVHRDGHSMQHHNEHHHRSSHHGHQFSSAKDHMASFKEMLGTDRYIEAIASKNALAGIPPSPGFVPIEGRHSSKGMYGKHHSSEHYAKKRQPLTDRVSSAEKTMAREMPVSREMPVASETPAVAVAPVGRQMPGLEKEVFITSPVVAPVARQMPGLEKPSSPVGRQMPALETPPSRAVPIGRQMPSLEQVAAVPIAAIPVAAALPVRSEGRIRHQPPSSSSAPGTRQLPQINI